MERRNFKTRSLIEASLMSALIVVLMIITGYVPIISLVGTFILPIPITILCIRHNYKITFSAIFVSGVLSSLVFNPLLAFTSAITYGSVGVILAYCIKSNKKVTTAIGLLTLDSIGVALMNILMTFIFIGKNSYMNSMKTAVNTVREMILSNKLTLASSGATAQQLETLDKTLELITIDMFMTILIGLIFVGAIISSYINYGVLSYILKKLKVKVESNIPITKIFIPNLLAAALIIIACIGIILTSKNIVFGKYIQNSGLYVLGILFLIDGVAVSIYYLRTRYKLTKPITLLVLSFVFIFQFHMVFIFLAVADVIFDFRKLDPNRLFKR